MTVQEVLVNRRRLESELQMALATMEKKNTIHRIKQQLENNQKQCSHTDSNYNWSEQGEQCPYCGMHFQINR